LRVEDIISKCLEGKAPRDVIRSIEEELPDISTVRMHLMTDLNRLGFCVRSKDILAEGDCIKVSVPQRIFDKRSSDLMHVCDTYSRTYAEIEVLAAPLIEET